MYREMSALIPATELKPRFASVYINDTKHATKNRKQFYGSYDNSYCQELQ